ncbi:S1C family serine protease [Rhizohabitans arisaemae]|uniref:S1C family serine protease n=1 Tax=Rhizohabitans arisaemae TaxID=2720610 RepID=UPI0024B0AF27|nr:trypsin-like peptidase domain-containing protein [Rhizohabitans arisaemae]
MRKLPPIMVTAMLGALLGCGNPTIFGTRETPSAPTSAPQASGTADTVVETRYEQAIARVLPSIVQITTGGNVGSGVVLDTAGNVVTNAHVVGKATQFEVTLATGGKPRRGRLVAAFPAGDLAVIRVENVEGLRPARFGDSSRVRVGQMVLAMGNPLGLVGSVTEGIISALGRTITEPQGPNSPGATIGDAIQTSAAINPGNSGGALVNLTGEVIGIPTLAAVDPALGGSPAPGIGFAIPSNVATDIANQIVKTGKVTNTRRAALGVGVRTVIGPDGEPIGVGVVRVDPKSGSAKAGIKPGDLIVSVNGTATPTTVILSEVLAGLKPGEQAKVEVVHTDGTEAILNVTLGQLPGT